MKKSIYSIMMMCLACTASSAQDTYQLTKINGDFPVDIAGKELKVGDTFDSKDIITWGDKKQSFEVKQLSSGNEYCISRRQFNAKGSDVKSIQDLLSYTSVEAARDESGSIKVNLVMKETNKREYYPEKRFALVIGNSFYSANPELQQGLPAMAEAQRKAIQLTDSLNELGYDVLDCYDLNTKELQMTLKRFAPFSREYAVALIYYAGHMLTKDGELYLMPVNVNPTDGMLTDHAVNVKEMVSALAKSSCASKTLVLDAKDMATGTPVDINIDVNAMVEDGSAAGIKVAYSINDDFLGERSENLYAKKKAEEEADASSTLDAIAALESQMGGAPAKEPVTDKECLEEGLRLLDKSSSSYNRDSAITYLTKSANMGNAEAMYQLATLYDGNDSMQAMLWMGRASSAGHPKAREYIAARKQAPKTKVVFYPKDK